MTCGDAWRREVTRGDAWWRSWARAEVLGASGPYQGRRGPLHTTTWPLHDLLLIEGGVSRYNRYTTVAYHYMAVTRPAPYRGRREPNRVDRTRGVAAPAAGDQEVIDQEVTVTR